MKAQMEARWKTGARVLDVLICFLPFFISAGFSLISPRPYFLASIKESDNYYNTANFALGYPIRATWHPGTPVIVLMSLFLRLLGFSRETLVTHAQYYLTTSHLLISLLASVSFLIFNKICLRNMPLPLRITIIVSFLLWPSALLYLDHYTNESFILVVSPLILTAFSYATSKKPGILSGILLSSVLALGLAVKLSFLPVVIAVSIAYFAHFFPGKWFSPPEPRGIFLGIFRVPLFACAVLLFFLLFTWPIRPYWGEMVANLLAREEIYPNLAELPKTMETAIRALFTASRGWLILFGAWATSLFAIGVICIRRRGGIRVSQVILVALLFSGWIYSLLALGWSSLSEALSNHVYHVSLSLRNCYPNSFFLPISIFFCFETISERHFSILQKAPSGWKGILISSGATALLILNLQQFMNARTSEIRLSAIDKQRKEKMLSDYQAPRHRVAFYDTGDSPFGTAGFHFWGAERFAGGYLLQEVAWALPEVTYFNVRWLNHFCKKNFQTPFHDVDGFLVPTREKLLSFRSIFENGPDPFWSHFLIHFFLYLSSPFDWPKPAEFELIAGLKTGLPLSAILIRQTSDVVHFGREALICCIESHFGLKYSPSESPPLPNYLIFKKIPLHSSRSGYGSFKELIDEIKAELDNYGERQSTLIFSVG